MEGKEEKRGGGLPTLGAEEGLDESCLFGGDDVGLELGALEGEVGACVEAVGLQPPFWIVR